MKNVFLSLLLVLSGISLNGYLNNLHRELYFDQYEVCSNEMETDDFDAIEACAKSHIGIKVLGTILFSDGSVIGDYYGLGNG